MHWPKRQKIPWRPLLPRIKEKVLPLLPPPGPDDAASALAELMASSEDEPSSSGDDDYDPFAALDDFGDQKEA